MTNEERKVIEMALEALENSVDLVVEDAFNAEQLYGNYPTRQGKVGGLKVLAEQHKQAITAIKEALAQPEQEPVAWMYPDALCDRACLYLCTKGFTQFPECATTPPQRKPLTHEQRFDLLTKFEPYKNKWGALAILIDMVEAAHGIKE